MNDRLLGNMSPADGAPVGESVRFRMLSSGERRYLYIPKIHKLVGFGGQAEGLHDAELTEVAKRAALAMVRDCRRTGPSQRPVPDDVLRDVVIHASQKCNLACLYCYAADLNRAAASMSAGVADAVVPHTLLLSQDGLSSVKFLGGEPTLAWPIVEQLVNEYRIQSLKRGWFPPEFVLVTNGTCLNRTMIDFIRKNDIFVWVSLDGAQEVHDRLRPTRAGRGSYAKAVESIGLLLENGVRAGTETVFTSLHLAQGITPQDIVEHVVSLGIRHVQIAPAVGTWHGCGVMAEEQEVCLQFEQAARSSVRSFRTRSPYLLRGIDFILRGYVAQRDDPYMCGAGRSLMAINYDGEAFPCYLLESGSTSYGYIGEGWLPSRYEQVKAEFTCNRKARYVACRTCWAREICKTCLGVGFQASGAIGKPPDWFCALQKSVISGVLAEIARASESPEWPLFLRNVGAVLGLHEKPELLELQQRVA